MESAKLITSNDDPRVPTGERYRVVYDPDPHTPHGDALAPCWHVDRIGHVHHRAEVASDYDPRDLDADTISAALDHYGSNRDDLVKVSRYLRIWHGVTATEFIRDNRGGVLYVIADTPAWRAHVGCIDLPADIAGDVAEWQSYIAGDVYGVIHEQCRTGVTTWNDGTTDVADDWQEIDAVWGFFGLDSAESHITAEIGHN